MRLSKSTGLPVAFLAFSLILFNLTVAVNAYADNTIKFGAAVSLTGIYSTTGKNAKDGYDLAVKRLNELGGVTIGGKAYRFEVVYYDDESTPARGAQLVERLINQDGVKFVLGPYSSGITKAIAPVTEKYQIPLLDSNGADRELFKQGYRYFFAVLSTSEQYLTEAIHLAAEQAQARGTDPSALKIAIAIENDSFSQDIRAGITEDAKHYGMKVIIDDKLPPDLSDMSATLTKVKALKPDIFIVSAHAKGPALAIRQMKDLQVSVPMLAMTQCDSAQITEKFGTDANYAVCASQWDRHLSYEDKWFGTAEDFAQRFEKDFKYEPPYQAAESAAGVLVYADAIQRTGSLDPNKVRDALAATDLQTFFGNIKFDATGKNTAKPMVLYQIQDKTYKVVAPSRWASSKIIYPAPDWSQRLGH
jgi:branched-chain amino acid transport system substrate-binding protein